MIHLSMSACRPPELTAREFDDYVRERHLRFAKLLEGLRLLSATRVEWFHGPGVGMEPAWVIDAWWEDGDAVTRCFRSAGGLALLGDRMTMMEDAIPAIADATEQVLYGTSRLAMFDPTIGPRVANGCLKVHLLVPEGRGHEIDAVIDLFGADWPEDDSSGIVAYSVGRGTGTSYPLNNIITGIEPPLLPRTVPLGTALELWLKPGAALDAATAALAPLRSLLDDPDVVWWFGESREVMMSIPVSSFLAMDPVEVGR